MSDKKIRKTPVAAWVVLASMVVLTGVAVYFVKVFLSGDSGPKKKHFTIVTLMKPPPPPIKEKPPEPEQVREVQKKEEIFTPVPQDVANQDSKPAGEQDNAPAGDNLGLDAEGGAGGDAFGLVGKKGGRSLLAGGGGDGMGKVSLMGRYAGYIQHVKDEMTKRIWKILDEDGGWQKGKHQVSVRVMVDGKGAIVEYKIVGSSGNHKMDDAVRQAFSNYKMSQPPPDGQSKTMTIKISSQV